MAEPQRFMMVAHDEGIWMRHEDHEAVVAELQERLEGKRDWREGRIAELQEQIKDLRGTLGHPDRQEGAGSPHDASKGTG